MKKALAHLYLFLFAFVIGGFLALLSGCAASPDTLIYIDKSIYIDAEYAEDVKVDYKTESGVSSDAKFDGEISPDIKITPR